MISFPVGFFRVEVPFFYVFLCCFFRKVFLNVLGRLIKMDDRAWDLSVRIQPYVGIFRPRFLGRYDANDRIHVTSTLPEVLSLSSKMTLKASKKHRPLEGPGIQTVSFKSRLASQ